MKKYIAEFVGTFVLALTVALLGARGVDAIVIALIAGITLAMVVYVFGPFSGAHVNPAVTLGALSTKKISAKDALFYIIAQFAGAALAMLILFGAGIISTSPVAQYPTSAQILGEFVGAFVFIIGVASVVFGKVEKSMTGAVIGVSLFVGAIIASAIGSFGFLNPAVAFSVKSLTLIYGLIPLVSGVLAFMAYRCFSSECCVCSSKNVCPLESTDSDLSAK